MAISFNAPIAKVIAQIAPIATIFPPSTADLLVLGKRGASGLPWAAMSIFSAIRVIKTCTGAGLPDWVRELFKLRTDSIDLEIGLRLSLVPDHNNKAKNDLGEAKCLGVMITNNMNPQLIYKLDDYTNHIVQDAPISKSGEDVIVACFQADPSYKGPNLFSDFISLSVSTAKLAEFFVLALQGANSLAFFSLLPWAYFFIFSAFLICTGISREYPTDTQRHEADIIIGDLPVFGQPPSNKRRIFLGMPQNFRHRLVWRICWILGAVVYTISLMYSYALLPVQEDIVIICWTCFQILWLLLRFVFFWSAGDADSPKSIPPTLKRFRYFAGNTASSTAVLHLPGEHEQLSPAEMKKVQMLMMALSRFQIHFHRRGKRSYQEELQSHTRVEKSLLEDTQNTIKELVPHYCPTIPEGLDGDVTITAVIGDTVLRSANWFVSSTRDYSEFYDACIVRVESRGQCAVVPAARVLFTTIDLSAPKYNTVIDRKEPEMGKEEQDVGAPNKGNYGQRNYPQGTRNEGESTIEWRYWIPSARKEWLEFTSQDLKVLGKKGEWKSKEQIEATLNLPMRISFASYEELKKIRNISDSVWNDVRRLVG